MESVCDVNVLMYVCCCKTGSCLKSLYYEFSFFSGCLTSLAKGLLVFFLLVLPLLGIVGFFCYRYKDTLRSIRTGGSRRKQTRDTSVS